MIRTPFLSLVLLAAALVAAPTLCRAQQDVYFSLSTSQTFSPDQKPTINVYAKNVDALEFRAYRVTDAAQFFSTLEDLHEFGVTRSSPRENIDEQTGLERFHDWKRGWWRSIRDFFRAQFTSESRAQIRDWHSGRARRSRVTGQAGFAGVPILNAQRLVARWRMDLPPKYVSETSEIPLENLGPGLYLIEATDGRYRAYTVVIVSRIVLVTKNAPGQLVAFTLDRKSGEPVGNVKVSVWSKKNKLAEITTSPDGMGEVALQPTAAPGEDGEVASESNFVLAQHADDVAIVAPYWMSFSSNPREDWSGFVYTERPVYRPGHTVHFKAILRKRNGERLLLPREREAEVTIEDASNAPILKRTFTLSPFGSLNGSINLPTTAALGYYHISVAVAGGRATGTSGNFEVQEYKKPEYFVKVTPARTRVLQGETVQATIEARYYFGEPTANAKVKYVVHTQRAWDWLDQSESEGSDEDPDDDRYFSGDQILESEGTLDANGRLTINIPTRLQDQKFDVDYRIEARVTDAGNREISGHSAVRATYGSFRIAAEPASYLYRVNDSIPITVRAFDYEKRPIQTALKIELLEHTYRSSEGEPFYESQASTDATGYARFSVPAGKTGSLTLRVTARTPEGRDVQSRSGVWVVGARGEMWEEGSQRPLQIVADQRSYKVGDTARLVIMGGAPNAPYFVTTEGRTVMSRRIVRPGGAANVTLEIPITKESQPNFFVSVLQVKDNEFFKGEVDLKVPAVESTLSIEIAPSKQQFQPGEKATYNVLVKDSEGKPVKAELSFGAVDDALYAVRPESSGSIVAAFYPSRYGGVRTEQSLEFYFHGEAGKRQFPLAGMAGGGGSGGEPRRSLAQIKDNDFVQPKIRKAFPDTAFWAPTIVTDGAGRATVRLAFPDALTTWRTTVRAVTLDTKAGFATNRVIVRKNLIVRLAAPRFFRQGDEITVSTIAHNYLESAKKVRISLEAAGAQLVSGAVQEVEVARRGEARLDWTLRTTGERAIKLTAKALSNEESDALEITLPVVPFGVRQTISATGTIGEPTGRHTAELRFDPRADRTTREINVSLTPSLAGAIFSGLEYLTSFPYGCVEQTMSSFLPNIVVSTTLRDLNVPNRVDQALLKRQVQSGFERLYEFQHEDGGWGWWKNDGSMVFMTAYVVAGMAQARDAGYEVQQDSLRRGTEFLKNAVREHPRMIADLRAYVVYALSLAGERDQQMLETVWRNRSKMSAEGIALAGLTMRMHGDARSADAAQSLRDSAQREGDAAYWPSAKDDLLEIDVDNSAEATAYAVKLLAQVDGKDPLLPAAVQWMMRHRADGYWYSTKQTAMVLFGITEYLKATRELEAAFDAEVSVNGRQAVARKFAPADAASGAIATATVPPASLSEANTVEIRKSGQGKLYWNATASYYSTDRALYNKNGLKLSIAREYFRMKSAAQDGKILYDLDPLSGPLAVGDVLAIRVTVTGDKWKYLMIEDPIPAGTEFIERDELYNLRSKPNWWRNWYDRREFRDDRAVMFVRDFYTNVHEYFYLVRVTNPGKFQVSPAAVRPMYQPDVFATTPPAAVEAR